MSTRPANRLAQETSPYLLQHQHNPVDWHPWGPEALERARKEDKPIFLSVGYSACHWCHVMERESFEDDDVAKLLNASFVPIKVDREERPDIDAIYMTATVAMSGSGGWPMSVFLTPDGKPFFAGTYFPKSSKYGRPGFTDILAKIAELWTKNRPELLEQAEELVRAVQAEAAADPPRAIDARAESTAAEQLLRAFDEEWGGFGGAPKFPAPASISLLLRQYERVRHERLLEAATTTLDRMARGGMYDHVGGGFARYSTDEKWHVPHFEKMLYDNAQLARVYVEAWQVTKQDRFRRVAEETLEYVIREMQGPHGGYFSATDADSEGEEGKFFVWSQDEIQALLSEEDAAAVIAAFDVRPRGNWEGHNVLWIPVELDDVAKELGTTRSELDERIARSKKILYEARAKRVHPLLDDKVLVSWNGLMLSTMAFAGRALGAPHFVESAARAAAMIKGTMTSRDGRLLRTFRAGDGPKKAHIDAFLEDYACLADGLVDLYEATGEQGHLDESLRLADFASKAFLAEDGQSFATTSTDHEALVVRMREGADNATPSANAVLARALARLSAHLGRDDLRARAEAAVLAHGRAIARMPRAFATTLEALNRLVEPPIEIALVGSPGDETYAALDRIAGATFLPAAVIARLDPAKPSNHPLLQGKTLVGGAAAAYVCRRFACQAPVTEADAFAKQLAEAKSQARADRAASLDVPKLGDVATAESTRGFAARRDDASIGEVLGLTVNRAGVLVASYRENDASLVIARAIELGRNLVAIDPQRASALGDALEEAVRESRADRASLVLAGVLLTNEPWPDVVRSAQRLVSDARLTKLDVLLVPWSPDASERVAEVLTHLEKASLATHLGVVVDGELDAPMVAAIEAKLPPLAKVVAAPLNVLESDLSAPAKLAGAGRVFFAVRPLDARAPAPAGGRSVMISLADVISVNELPDAPPFAPALAALRTLEDEYRKTVAVHLRVEGQKDFDIKDLLAWSEELGRAEKMLDDLLETEAFVAQSVTPALRAQFGALASIQGQLAPIVESLRDRYLEALDRALKALARRVATRQTAMAATLAGAMSASKEPGGLAAAALGAVLGTPGVAATLVTCRTPITVDVSDQVAEPAGDAVANARKAFKKS